ncbi:thiol reductant ABC exporter subunit CydC [Paraglaciecola sp. L3A3]|uniref:thiol reductant ABC exporter subunit CydC n=1 Tax=Paraglaciecola sp. L3A3 TaxID=2686358 RepID=UPI00131AAA86|nr:thiol reductant ABC exporter subunit CydC [Paraglaciecola sp. L3A3]
MKVFFRLIHLLKPQLPLMLLGALLSVITVLANISLLAVSGWFITLMAIGGSTGISVNYFTPAAIIRFLAIVRTAGRYSERMLTHRATFNALAYLRHYFYQQLEPLLPYYRMDLRSGDLLTRLQQDVDNLDNFYLRVLLPLFVALISVPIICYALAQISPVIAWLMFSALLIVAVILPIFSYLASKTLAQQKTLSANHLSETLVNGISAIKTLLVYQVSLPYQNSIAKLTQQYYDVCYRLVKINAAMNALIFLIIHLSALLCLLLLLPLLTSGEVDSKSLVAVILLVLVSFETVMNMPLALQLLPQSLASASRLFAIIDKEKPLNIGTKPVHHGDIEYNDLTFCYPQQKEPSLRDIKLSIKAAEKVAVIGASGAGKSSLVNLLMGFWPIGNGNKQEATSKGTLTIGGEELNQIDQELLRQHIALMSQQGHLFSASIADNLRLAKHDATEGEMRHVCQQVNLLDFIDSLPKSFDTWLGTTGTGLSGGQAQRLQIAQLLLRPAKVIILDEPTKGLDKHNETSVMNNILEHINQQNQSLIVITHKPLMLEKMDNIIVMAEGKIIAQGNHQQLLANNQYYQQLLNYF